VEDIGSGPGGRRVRVARRGSIANEKRVSPARAPFVTYTWETSPQTGIPSPLPQGGDHGGRRHRAIPRAAPQERAARRGGDPLADPGRRSAGGIGAPGRPPGPPGAPDAVPGPPAARRPAPRLLPRPVRAADP